MMTQRTVTRMLAVLFIVLAWSACTITAWGGNETTGEADPDATTAVAGSPGRADGPAQSATHAEVSDVAAPETPDWSDFAPSDFVTPPDFETNVDYSEWYETTLLGKPEDNAYHAYAEFMPGPDDESGGKPEWPELRNMFSDGDRQKPPGPWRPEEHPEWTRSDAEVQALLQKFRDATGHEGYAQPVLRAASDADAPGGDDGLLISLLLPQLRAHRQLVKAELADSWRTDGSGRVSAKRMMEAWRTALRGAAHLSQGATLIEELVALAERNLVRDNARWALHHGVVSAEAALAAALELFAKYDHRDPDPILAVRGEHATAMDLTQYVFKPAEPGGPLRLNRERAAKVLSGMDSSKVDQDAALAELAELSPKNLRASVESIDRYYRLLARQLRLGYPQVRAADVKALREQHVGDDPWGRLIVPDLGQVLKARTRGIASRRATQLTLAVHLFKARHGRWPASLDELPAEHKGDTPIDPFTGRNFVYRLNDDGPTIYSASENGVDDAGRHSPRWDDEKAGDSDDFVFWPPQP